MGRRSINTTKSGKYMNPTDQARKEARKKELKKNKKQRQMVRAAVLKGKDPAQLIDEMEKIDEMEYNVYQPSPLNEKVLREKRKKLKETLDRVLRLYHNDDPELWAELKRKEVEYEKRRNKKVQYYESVKHAQSVQVDEIPLPQMNDTPIPMFSLPRMPMPAPPLGSVPFIPPPPHGILKKPIDIPIEKPIEKVKKGAPGCPPGPPPDLTQMRDLDSDYEEEPLPPRPKKSKIRFSDEVKSDQLSEKSSTTAVDAKTKDDDLVKPTSLQQRMLALSGQNIDEFMKEMENVQKKKEKERAADLKDRLHRLDDEKGKDDDEDDEDDKSSGASSDAEDINEIESDDDDDDDDSDEDDIPVKSSKDSASSSQIPNQITLPSGPPPPPVGMPPSMMFRPPPLRPSTMAGIRMPPGPPPGRPGLPPGPPPGMPPRLGMRIPPGPPLGMPPQRLMHNKNNNQNQSQQNPGNNVLAAGPQINKDSKGATVITAKPQIRNLSADVTRFVPSTLRVKREDKFKPKPKPIAQEPRYHQEQSRGPTKDDAYMQFMKEMQGLL